jgi:aldose 1-epimerase
MVTVSHHKTAAGQDFEQATLVSGKLEVSVLTLGAATRSIRFDGTETLLDYPDIDDYQDNPFYLGVIAGRVANRISQAAFELGGRTYHLSENWHGHSIHGGAGGFSKRNWVMEADSAANAVRLTLHSPDGDQGYPGAVEVTVEMRVSEDVLTYDITAVPSAPTPINLAQHNYYLSRALDLSLQVGAPRYCPSGEDLIPTGQIVPVTGHYDLSRSRNLSDMARDGQNIDANYVPDGSGLRQVAVLRAPGLFEMTVESDQPGLQVYTGHWLAAPFEPCEAVCLEPQYFPNAVNTPGFGDIIHTPDRPYRQTTRLRYRGL